MRRNYEIADFNTHMPLRCVMQQIGYVDSHMHDYFEIDLILSGHCAVTVDGHSYNLSPEDVITIDSHVPHELRSSDCTFICIQFEQSMFEQTLPDPQHPLFFCNSSVQGDNAAFKKIRTLIARIVKNNADQQGGYALRNWSYIYELMDVLYDNFRVIRTHAEDAQSHRYAARVTQIARLVREYHTENLSLSRLADMVHLSAPYLSKFFERQFGMTFLAYLTQIRLSHAVNELLNTEKIIEEVSADSGFPNSHAFVQAFKKEFGVLPSVYRRQNKDKKEEKSTLPTVEQHDYMAGLKKYLDFDVTAQVREENSISCSIKLSSQAKTKPLKHTWRSVMGVGSASDLLMAEIREMVERMVREIGFRYIKFNGIFSDELHIYNRKTDGTPVYNFAYIDKVFDFLRSIGLRPIIQLSFMPSALAKDKERRLFNYLVSEPISYSEWSELVRATVEHLLERYGAEEVRNWHFCVWNQPDTPKSLYGFDSNEAFYEFYKCTYSVVKSCDERLSFGTPPTFYIMDEGYTNWYIPFISWCRENGCIPDFLNFHYYDTALTHDANSGQELFGFIHSMILRQTQDGLHNFIDQVLSEREKLGMKKIPIYLTEWNNTPSQQDLLNDTCFKSCYIVKNILENYDRIDSFGYWSLTDWMAEAPLPKEMFFGGLGLFTVNSIPKASFYALSLLRRLGNTFVGSGEGWFATKQVEKYIIILYNYRHFSRLYALGERFDMTFTDRYTPFDPVQLLDVHLSLSDIEDGEYLVRETVLNRRSGSAFDQWLEMGAMELDTEQEIEILKARSVPSCSKYVAKANGGSLELDAMLEMLEVRLLMIEPYRK